MTSVDASSPYWHSSKQQVPLIGIAPISSHAVSIVFRLSRPRTWVFPSIALILGYSLAGGASLQRLLLGLAVACLVTASTNLVNAYADRIEDVVNQPSRVLWLERIGPRRTIAAAVLLYATAVAVSLELGALFMLVLGLGILNSIFYSLPPLRFKANPVLSLVSFSGAVGLAFQAGMSMNGPLDLLNPVFWLCAYFMLTYGAVKNLPDYHGDKRAGVRTSATIFHNISAAIVFSSALLSTPYLLLVGLVAAGVVRTSYLLDLGFLPVLFLIFRQMWSTKTPEGLEKAHTVGFFYAISFLMFTLILSSPTIIALATLFSVYIWTLLVSKVNVDSRAERRDWESAIKG